jgi:hypothetical protein
MIASFLQDYYPEMSSAQREALAEAMDLSLIERKKEELIKSFFEMNSTIRMSWIEMQYMKKVRVSTCGRIRKNIISLSAFAIRRK